MSNAGYPYKETKPIPETRNPYLRQYFKTLRERARAVKFCDRHHVEYIDLCFKCEIEQSEGR
jgi:hypothetical protein